MIAEFLPRLLKVTAITFSGIAVGGAGTLVALHIRDAIHGNTEAIAWAMARAGFVIIVVLLAKLVIRLPELPPTGDVWWYVIGLILAGMGYAWLAFHSIRQAPRRRR